MAKLVNSSLTSYSLATPKDFKAQHLKAHYSKPVKHSGVDSSFDSVKLKSLESSVYTYDHYLIFNKFINQYKFHQKINYAKVTPYRNATKNQPQLTTGKRKRHFEK